eukprot:UN21713
MYLEKSTYMSGMYDIYQLCLRRLKTFLGPLYVKGAAYVPKSHIQCVLKQNHMKNRGLPQLQRRREAPERVAGPCEVRDTSQSIQYARSKLLLVHILF